MNFSHKTGERVNHCDYLLTRVTVALVKPSIDLTKRGDKAGIEIPYPITVMKKG